MLGGWDVRVEWLAGLKQGHIACGHVRKQYHIPTSPAWEVRAGHLDVGLPTCRART